MKTKIVVAVLMIALVALLLLPATSSAQSCYAIMYTEVLSGDTWSSIASHWGMTVSTLKAMNKDVPQRWFQPIPGSMLKIAVFVGCPKR